MTMKMTASLLLGELQSVGNVIEPLRDGVRLVDVTIASKDERPIAVFTYEDGRKATLGVGDAKHGITAFVMDGVLVGFARVGAHTAEAIGLDMTSMTALNAAGVQVVTNVERMRADDVTLCVGPMVDVAALDARPRYEGVIPSLTTDELAIARAQTWTPAGRYRAAAEAEKARRFEEAKTKVQSSRDPNYVPAWGVRAASAAASTTPGGRVPLGRVGRR